MFYISSFTAKGKEAIADCARGEEDGGGGNGGGSDNGKEMKATEEGDINRRIASCHISLQFSLSNISFLYHPTVVKLVQHMCSQIRVLQPRSTVEASAPATSTGNET